MKNDKLATISIAVFFILVSVLFVTIVVDLCRIINADYKAYVSSLEASASMTVDEPATDIQTTQPESVDAVRYLPDIELHLVTEATNGTKAEPSTIPLTVPESDSKPLFDPNDKELLARVIYQEAGGDACCDDCRRRVADVVLNRVESPYFPDTIKGVLTQKYQYGRYYWTGIVWPERAKSNAEKHAVERAYQIAEEVLTGNHSELYGKGYIWQAEFRQGKDNIKCCGIYFGR